MGICRINCIFSISPYSFFMKIIALLFCSCMLVSLSATKANAQDESLPVFKSYAKDSTQYSNDKKIISLYGNAKVVADKFSVVADALIYDSEKQILTVKNLKSFSDNKKRHKELVAGSSFVIKLKGDNYDVVK